MQRKIVPVLIIIIAVVFSCIYLAKKFLPKEEETAQFQNNFLNKSISSSRSSKDAESYEDESKIVSLIPLNPDETAIGVVSMDFNGDGFDDQVNKIKTGTSPYISLLVGIYNPSIGEYERKAVIATPVTQSNNFTFTGMDLTGDHRTALIYQGLDSEGNSLCQAYFIKTDDGKFSLTQIADLKSEGTIFVQQVDRYDAYERSRANGASFPIWVYEGDSSNPDSTDQLQIKYDWNSESGRYVQVQKIRVPGSKITAAELSRIQDGTVETFAEFLNGLWYKIDSVENDILYVFFDYRSEKDSSEIIFFHSEEEEVFKWNSSTLRKNRISLSTRNQEQENLNRTVDVYLRNVDEINIRIQDDLRMIISEGNLWDGSYKKVNQSPSYAMRRSESNSKKMTSVLEENPVWKMNDDTEITFKGGTYTAEGEITNDTGLYTNVRIQDKDFIQFRSNGEYPLFKGMYLVTFTDESKDTLNFKSYKVYPDEVQPSDEKEIVLTRK
ncbi:MAG: pallilysin-related adhesin [Treponema sp.]|nr:pallilysin-related adhesin [Spirochaetia bacterium]MDY4902887.1 pallilysin-related adhesin [Treponema sp.]